MKYFNPIYWFKVWLLTAQLFNDQIKNINSKIIYKQQNINDWTNKNIFEISKLRFLHTDIKDIITDFYMINQTNYQKVNPFYQKNVAIKSLYNDLNHELKTTVHKHPHENSNKLLRTCLKSFEKLLIHFFSFNLC